MANVMKRVTNITSLLIRKRRQDDIRLADSERRGVWIKQAPRVWNFPKRSLTYDVNSMAGMGARLAYFPSRLRNASVSGGKMAYKSPTTPYRASLKIGASGSLLIATMILLERIPA